MFEQQAISRGEAIAAGDRVSRDETVERVSGKSQIHRAGHDIADAAIVDAKTAVPAQPLLPIALCDPNLARLDQEANLEEADRRDEQRLTGGDDTVHASMTTQKPKDGVRVEKNHFRALKVTPPREDGSNAHWPRSTAGSTHSRVTEAFGVFFRGPATESR